MYPLKIFNLVKLLPILLCLGLLSERVGAASLEGVVIDKAGKPVGDAIVYALPQKSVPGKSPPIITVDQIDKEFVNRVTPLQTGSAVNFPNSDDIRHHVYSFSPAKTFELPLYMGTPAKPVIFDKAGEITLGCNIHDWMHGHIYVVDTPFFVKTGEDGKGKIDLTPGEYEVYIWHQEMQGKPEENAQRVTVVDSGKVNFTIDRKRVWKIRRAPNSAEGGGYF